MEKEIWSSILNGDYEVSNFGNVKSNKFKVPRLLKPDNNRGYLRVRLQNRWFPIHRLVAKEFIPNSFNKPQVNHKDENKLNNKWSNLEWVTQRENIEYSSTKKSITKIKGVHWIERMNCYQCSIYFNGKKNYLGSTKDLQIAKKRVHDFLINNNLI